MSDLRAILRSTWLLAALGSVVAGIRDSCSGYAGFRPWLLAAGPPRPANANSRVDRRSTRDFALYQGLNPAWLFQLRCFLALVACRGAAAPGKRKNARTVTDRIMEKKTFRFTGAACL